MEEAVICFTVSFSITSESVLLLAHVLSVSRARFVTTGAIDLKLCTYVPLGVQTKFRSYLILGLATKGPKPKMQKLTDVKFHNGTISWHVSLLFDLEHSNLVGTCV
jgi:hypothetical protein